MMPASDPGDRRVPRRRPTGTHVNGGEAGYGQAWLWVVVLVGLLSSAGCAPTIDDDVRLAGIGTSRAAADPKPVPRFTQTSFIAADGEDLPLRRWLPEGQTLAVILALHGFNDYSNSFEEPAKAWARQGIATYAYDQRGFGATRERGFWPGRSALAADVATATQILRRLYPGRPLYLLGESMGGAVAIVALSGESGPPAPEVDGVILTAPAVWGRATMEILPRIALWVGVRLAPALTLTGRGLEIKASDNIAMLRKLSRDPMVIKATRIDTIYGLVDLMDAAADAAPSLDVPMLMMYGAKDEIIPKRSIWRFIDRLPAECRGQMRLAWYQDGYHMLLRDLDGSVVGADVASWALAPGALLPSGADRAAMEAFLRNHDQVSSRAP
jgi:alpha-beta hydrolase superfamily lysophospholipase